MNRTFTNPDGSPVVSREGVTFLEPVSGGPEPVLGATLRLKGDLGGARSVEIVLPAALSASFTAMSLLSFGMIGGVEESFEWTVPGDVLAQMKAAAGTYTLADANVIFGGLSGTAPGRVEVKVLNAAGWGLVRDIWAYQTEATEEPVIPFVKTGDPVLSGTHTEGNPVLIATALAWTGDPRVEITYEVYQTADDASGTNASAAFAATGFVPSIVTTRDTYRVGAYATGPGVPGGRAGPYWSNWQAITAAAGTSVTVTAPPMAATNRVKLKSVSGSFPKATSTGRATITAGAATATIVEYVSATGMLYLGDITGGPITGNTAITSSAGGSAAADGDSAAWAYKAGEAYYLAPPVFNVAPTTLSALPKAQYDTDSAHASPKPIDLVGTFPQWLGTRYIEFAWEYTGPGVTGVGRSATAWLPIGKPTLTALPVDAWFPVVAAEPGVTNGRRITGIYLLDTYVIDGSDWTTSSDEKLATVQYPTDREPTTANGATTVVNGQTYVLRNVGTAVHGTKDYAVFVNGDAADDARETMLGYTVWIGGEMTPMGVRQSVPDIIAPPASTRTQYRMTMQAQANAEAGKQGGTCMQFPRAVDSIGDEIWMFHDVGRGVVSYDAGENWQIANTDGLGSMQTTSGIVIDGRYIHGMFGALFMQKLGNYDTKSGLWRYDRTGTKKWTQRKALAQVYGSNDGAFRRSMRYVAIVVGSGSGPETRTVFALHAPAEVWTGAGGLTNFQMYKSTNGGDTYAADGNAMPTGTFGVPYEIWATSTALYIGTSDGLWRRPIGGTAWTKATGLAAGAVYHFEVHGSTVFASVASASGGLYKATDSGSGSLAFSRILTGNVWYFAISPTNTNKRVALMNPPNNTTPAPHQYTSSGDTGWKDGSSTQYLGQENDFAHRMYGNSSVWVKAHKTDDTIFYAMRFQHPGKSDDSGATFRWASKNDDYSEVRDIAVAPSHPKIMAFGATDRLMIYAQAPEFTIDIPQGKKSSLKSDTNDILSPGKQLGAQSCSGVVILERGSYRRFLGQVGEHTKPKVLVRFEKTTSTTRTDQTATGNGAVTISSTHNIPGGDYKFACTVTGGTGVGKLRGTAPMGLDMGEWTVGTERTWNHPYGGSITAKFEDGGVDWKTTAVVTYDVNPLGDYNLMNNATRTSAQVGQTNPAVPYRGCTGRYSLEMDTSGVVSLVRVLSYEFQGYMGPSGDVLLGVDGNTKMMRSPDGGASWTNIATFSGTDFGGVGHAVTAASPNDANRAYAGLKDGRVARVQNGVIAYIFDFDAWLTARGITTSCPGMAQRNGRWCPPVLSVVESPHDPNLVHAALYTFGEPYALFRCQNAQASSGWVWENITFDANGEGLGGPIQRMRQHDHTSEPVLCSVVGTAWVDLPEGFRAAKGITASMIADTKALPGFDSYTAHL